jgi:hypothetical protein
MASSSEAAQKAVDAYERTQTRRAFAREAQQLARATQLHERVAELVGDDVDLPHVSVARDEPVQVAGRLKFRLRDDDRLELLSFWCDPCRAFVYAGRPVERLDEVGRRIAQHAAVHDTLADRN